MSEVCQFGHKVTRWGYWIVELKLSPILSSVIFFFSILKVIFSTGC